MLDLENQFKKSVERSPNELPTINTYSALYDTTLANLVRDIYPLVDIGLSINSNPRGIYTYHNKDHFDEVVVRAGELIQMSSGQKNARLNPYELFVLLIAIRIHDAGNCLGRDQHEKNCYEILREVGGNNFPFGDEELTLISHIAQAHGGTTDGIDKDVISRLPKTDTIGNSPVRFQRIAALVRFADEVAENRLRSLNFLAAHGGMPRANEIFHAYASSITTSMVERHESSMRVVLKYRVEESDLEKKFGKNDGDTYLIDEIRDRLKKMNRERIYCNRFVHETERISTITAFVRVANGQETMWKHEYLIRDEGYPQHEGDPSALRDLHTTLVLQAITAQKAKA